MNKLKELVKYCSENSLSIINPDVQKEPIRKLKIFICYLEMLNFIPYRASYIENIKDLKVKLNLI